MALYEYQCETCGNRFEVIQKWSDPPKDKCPKCGGPVHKLQSAPAFQFKGTGWYVTDYAKKDQGGSGKSSSDSTADAKSSSGSSGSEKSDKSDKSDKAEKSDKASESSKPSSPSDTSAGPTPSKNS